MCQDTQQLIKSKIALLMKGYNGICTCTQHWTHAILHFWVILWILRLEGKSWNKSHEICILCVVQHILLSKEQSVLSCWIFSHLKRFPNVCMQWTHCKQFSSFSCFMYSPSALAAFYLSLFVSPFFCTTHVYTIYIQFGDSFFPP